MQYKIVELRSTSEYILGEITVIIAGAKILNGFNQKWNMISYSG
jgi:hypothetical protein